MKAQIESNLLNTTPESANSFVYLMNTITGSLNEKDLRERMKQGSFLLSLYFEWGFGKNHMWVHEKDFNGMPRINRLIYVEF